MNLNNVDDESITGEIVDDAVVNDMKPEDNRSGDHVKDDTKDDKGVC